MYWRANRIGNVNELSAVLLKHASIQEFTVFWYEVQTKASTLDMKKNKQNCTMGLTCFLSDTQGIKLIWIEHMRQKLWNLTNKP